MEVVNLKLVVLWRRTSPEFGGVTGFCCSGLTSLKWKFSWGLEGVYLFHRSRGVEEVLRDLLGQGLGCHFWNFNGLLFADKFL